MLGIWVENDSHLLPHPIVAYFLLNQLIYGYLSVCQGYFSVAAILNWFDFWSSIYFLSFVSCFALMMIIIMLHVVFLTFTEVNRLFLNQIDHFYCVHIIKTFYLSLTSWICMFIMREKAYYSENNCLIQTVWYNFRTNIGFFGSFRLCL